MLKKFFPLGSASIIAAITIGASSPTIYTIVGSTSGPILIWGVIVSIIAIITLYELVARITLATGKSIDQVILENATLLPSPLVIFLLLVPLSFGIIAYLSSSIINTAMAINSLTNLLGIYFEFELMLFVVSLVCFAVLYKFDLPSIIIALSKLLIFTLIILLLLTFFLIPSWSDLLDSLLTPAVLVGKSLVLVSTISIAIIPFGLFLYSFEIILKKSVKNLSEIRSNINYAGLLAGLVASCIIIISSSISSSAINNASSLISLTHPSMGILAQILIGGTLIVIGFCSIVLAPLALGLIISKNVKSDTFSSVSIKKWTWTIVFLAALILSIVRHKPTHFLNLISFCNGLFLPLLVIYLLFLANKRSIMKTLKNKWQQNLVAIAVIILCTIVGLKNIFIGLNLI